MFSHILMFGLLSIPVYEMKGITVSSNFFNCKTATLGSTVPFDYLFWKLCGCRMVSPLSPEGGASQDLSWLPGLAHFGLQWFLNSCGVSPTSVF